MRADDIAVANVVKGNPEKEMADVFCGFKPRGIKKGETNEKRGAMDEGGETKFFKPSLGWLAIVPPHVVDLTRAHTVHITAANRTLLPPHSLVVASSGGS